MKFKAKFSICFFGDLHSTISSYFKYSVKFYSKTSQSSDPTVLMLAFTYFLIWHSIWLALFEFVFRFSLIRLMAYTCFMPYSAFSITLYFQLIFLIVVHLDFDFSLGFQGQLVHFVLRFKLHIIYWLFTHFYGFLHYD